MDITLGNGIVVDIYDEHPIVAQLNALVESGTIDIRVPLDQMESYIGRTVLVQQHFTEDTVGVLNRVHFDGHDNYYSLYFEDGSVAGIDGDSENAFVIVLAQ